MVQLMEAWFLADKSALRAYYGNNLRQSRLPANRNVEQIPKDDVLGKLDAATRETGKGEYGKHKVRHAADLLGQVSPQLVRHAADHCDRLFRALEHAITQENQRSSE